MELLCRCYDIPDDGVEVRVLKGLLTAITSNTIHVHGQALLLVRPPAGIRAQWEGCSNLLGSTCCLSLYGACQLALWTRDTQLSVSRFSQCLLHLQFFLKASAAGAVLGCGHPEHYSVVREEEFYVIGRLAVS